MQRILCHLRNLQPPQHVHKVPLTPARLHISVCSTWAFITSFVARVFGACAGKEFTVLACDTGTIPFESHLPWPAQYFHPQLRRGAPRRARPSICCLQYPRRQQPVRSSIQGCGPVGGNAWQLFWKWVLIDLKKTGGHDAKVTFNLNVTKSSRKFRTMAWNDQYNLEFAPYHSICRLFVHFQVRIYFLAAATIEKIVWKHCNQFRSKIVVVVLPSSAPNRMEREAVKLAERYPCAFCDKEQCSGNCCLLWNLNMFALTRSRDQQ